MIDNSKLTLNLSEPAAVVAAKAYAKALEKAGESGKALSVLEQIDDFNHAQKKNDRRLKMETPPAEK